MTASVSTSPPPLSSVSKWIACFQGHPDFPNRSNTERNDKQFGREPHPPPQVPLLFQVVFKWVACFQGHADFPNRLKLILQSDPQCDGLHCGLESRDDLKNKSSMWRRLEKDAGLVVGVV